MKRTGVIHLVILLGYLLLSIAFTWPLVAHFSTALPGEGTDSWQYLWNFWWFDQALFHGQPLYSTHAQYYPQGTSLLFHTLSPLNSLVGLPARLLGGYVAAYNLVVLLSTVLSGYGVYLLTREVLSEDTADASPALHLAAFFAGAIFALAPYRSAHLLGHLSLVSTETLPFFTLFAFRALRRPGWKAALGITLSWLAAALIDWYYPFYMLLLAAFFLAWALGEALLRRRSQIDLLRSGATLAGGLLVAALLISPLLVPMLRQTRASAYLAEPLEFSTTYGADLAAFFLPSPLHPLWGRAFLHWTDPLADGNTAEGIVYMGFVALVLAAAGFWRARKQGRLWAALAGLFGLLSLGPYLKVVNQRTGVPLPYLLLARLPIARFTRVPARYAILLHLGIAVLAGLGVWALLNWGRHVRGRRSAHRTLAYAASGLLLAMTALEYLPAPYPVTPAVIPPFYRQLAEDPGEYALLELPLQRPASQWYYTHWMLDQTVHGKYSFRGYISRGDPLFSFGGAPLFRQLAGLGSTDVTYDDWRDLAQPVLSYYRVGYIVLERARLEEEGRLDDAEALVREMVGSIPPAFRDDNLTAYKVDWGPRLSFARLGHGWHEVEEQTWGTFRWMERDRAELYVALPEARRVTLSFQAVSFLRPRRLEILVDGKAVMATEVGTVLQPYSVKLPLPAGETLFELRAEGYDVPAQVGAGVDTREVSIGVSEVRVRVEE